MAGRRPAARQALQARRASRRRARRRGRWRALVRAARQVDAGRSASSATPPCAASRLRHRRAGAAHQPRHGARQPAAAARPTSCSARCDGLDGQNIVRADLDGGAPQPARLAVDRRGDAAPRAAVDHRDRDRRAASRSALARLGARRPAPRRRRRHRARPGTARATPATTCRSSTACTPVAGRALSGPASAIGVPARVDPERADLAARVVDALAASPSC